MKALIDPRTGDVYQLADSAFPVAPPLTWVDAPDGVTTSHTWNGEAFIAPPAPEPEPDIPSASERIEALITTLHDKGVLNRERDLPERVRRP